MRGMEGREERKKKKGGSMDRKTCLLNYNNASKLDLFDKWPQASMSHFFSYIFSFTCCD